MTIPTNFWINSCWKRKKEIQTVCRAIKMLYIILTFSLQFSDHNFKYHFSYVRLNIYKAIPSNECEQNPFGLGHDSQVMLNQYKEWDHIMLLSTNLHWRRSDTIQTKNMPTGIHEYITRPPFSTYTKMI